MGSVMEIKCNNCGYIDVLHYGCGYFGQENHFYYCPKCFRIKEYGTAEFEDNLMDLPTELPQIKKCGYCKKDRLPFEFIFSEEDPEIKGPEGYCCPKCQSNDIAYEEVALWD